MISVCLASYNGEKYIGGQLSSILLQLSDDDGSTDSTLFIINEYLRQFSNIFLLLDKVTQRKSMGSFMWMLENVKTDYYMFCDHDDYWLPNKISLTLEKMLYTESISPEKPVIIHTDLKVVNTDLQEIFPSFWRFSKIRPDLLLDFNYQTVYNGLIGCTMMINDSARIVSLPMNSYRTMHDAWIGLKVANTGGVIDYISTPTVLYRQHENNVIGAKEVGTVSYFLN